MAILGIGIDIVDVRWIEKNYRSLDDLFTGAEKVLCMSRPERMACFAKRYAAKEACIKALGTNDAIGGVHASEIEVILTKSGRPTLRLMGGAKKQLYALCDGYVAELHLSLSDFLPMAQAIVIIETSGNNHGELKCSPPMTRP